MQTPQQLDSLPEEDRAMFADYRGWCDCLPAVLAERLAFSRGISHLESRALPLRFVEVGVHKGETSRLLLSYFPNASLHMVDPWGDLRDEEYRLSGDSCAFLSDDEQAACLLHAMGRTAFAEERRTIVRQTSLEAAGLFAECSVDAVFLDADHTYEAVRDDLVAWSPKIASKGVLCGHDFGHPRDRRGSWGVGRAVREFAVKHSLTIRLHKDTIWSVAIENRGPRVL